MNHLFTELGVPPELQALFNSPDGVFDFGDSFEFFEKSLHKVPTTQNLWRVIPPLVTDVIVTWSAMEALAYLTLNRHLYKTIENVACVAIGNYPHNLQTGWIRDNLKKRKITLVFSNCVLGTLADIKVAGGVRLLPVRMQFSAGMIIFNCKGLTRSFDQLSLSLNAFEKAFGIRSGIKTRKPKNHLTFLDELINYGK